MNNKDIDELLDQLSDCFCDCCPKEAQYFSARKILGWYGIRSTED